MPSPLKPREQGDLGELSAMEWLTSQGTSVAIPIFHSPDWDLIAEAGGRVLRVQVKTCACRTARGHYHVRLSTSGGNQSWNRVIKRFDPSRYDYLFVLVADGRRWFIPAGAIDGSYSIVLGGYEVEPGRPLVAGSNSASLESGPVSGEYPRGQRTAAVNRQAQPSQVRLLPPPSIAARPSNGAVGSPEVVRIGRACIWGKGQITIPAGPRHAAGLRVGDALHVEARNDGTLLVRRIGE
jgi:AbrB family looped-hinge helix DNA binding protein